MVIKTSPVLYASAENQPEHVQSHKTQWKDDFLGTECGNKAMCKHVLTKRDGAWKNNISDELYCSQGCADVTCWQNTPNS